THPARRPSAHRREDPPASRRLARPLRRQHPRRRDDQFQAGVRVPQRRRLDPARRRALHAALEGHTRMDGENRRSEDVDRSLDDRPGPHARSRRAAVLRVPRKQLRPAEHPPRRPRDGWQAGEPMKTTMMGVLLCLVAASAAAQSVAGDWQGTLKFGPGELRLILHLTENGSELAGTIDSPDQNVKGIPVSAISRKGNALKLDLMSIQGGYEGMVDAGATSIKGTWTQLGMSAPLDWSRAAATPA